MLHAFVSRTQDRMVAGSRNVALVTHDQGSIMWGVCRSTIFYADPLPFSSVKQLCHVLPLKLLSTCSAQI